MTFREALVYELQNLPGEAAHLEMFPLRGRTSEALKTAVNYRLSGVMALLYPVDDTYHIILTERQTYDGKHSGQMSFPGGKLEPGETTSLEAALRETQEEIGIDPTLIEVAGSLSQVYIPVSNFLVHPYIGFLEKEPDYLLNEREVKSLVVFNILELLRAENRVITTISTGPGSTIKDVPAFQISDKIIWGATALMLNEIRFMLQRMYPQG